MLVDSEVAPMATTVFRRIRRVIKVQLTGGLAIRQKALRPEVKRLCEWIVSAGTPADW